MSVYASWCEGRKYFLRNGEVFFLWLLLIQQKAEGYSFNSTARMRRFTMRMSKEDTGDLTVLHEILLLCETRADVEKVLGIPPITPIPAHEAVQRLTAATTVDQWNNCVDRIVDSYDGEYPGWWTQEVFLSGLAAKAQRRWL